MMEHSAAGEKSMRKTLSKPIRRDFQGLSVKWRRQSPKEYRTLALLHIRKKEHKKIHVYLFIARQKCRKDKTESNEADHSPTGLCGGEEGMGFGWQG